MCQTAYLIGDDGPIPSSSSTEYPELPPVTALQHAVGSSLVGLGNQPKRYGGFGLGLGPDANVPYGIDEFSAYDPIIPMDYFTQWRPVNGTGPGVEKYY